MKPLLIVNPASGNSSRQRILPLVRRCLDKKGIAYDIAYTRAAGHATQLSRQAALQGRPAVFACGGDGTVNEIASGLIGTSTAMGIIPTGSGNGLARHLGIPVDIRRSVGIIADGNIVAIDYGTANDVNFFCTFGVGFDAAVSERCLREHRRGLAMYIKNAITEYINFTPEEYIIEANGQRLTENAFLVVACNASQYGNNAFIAPTASVTDGMLDLIVVHAGNLLTQAAVGVDMLTGNLRSGNYVHIIRTPHARIIRKKPGAAHADGDAVQMGEEIQVKCNPAKLRVFAPTKKTSFRPFVTPVMLTMRDIGLYVYHLWTRRKGRR